MPKNVFQFECPCCGKDIEVDTRSGKARAVDPKDKRGKDFDALVDEQTHDDRRLNSLFDDAKHDQDAQSKRFDSMFKDAAQRARNDKGKPRNPFDLE